ncbi:hypothetical protein, partial [Streptobacillus moniliformis]|uniref:hypothetical protein n=1 Tax=Streptobacillus moniliformis TaxID=34105 RepID=UPI000A659AF7
MFTTNDYSEIPRPLFDRMDVIKVDSSTIQENVVISRNNLVKQAKEKTRIKDVKFTDSDLIEIINIFAMEAGVCNL